jgi:hypothetical protein
MVAGASQALFGLFMARMFDWMSRTPANAYVAQSGSSVRAEMDSGLGALAVLTWWGTVIWMVILLVVTAIDNMKRGWHDKVAGSVVLGPLQAPAYTPTAAWPSQATGAPPAAPGYPPSAYPGYPGYPGYPPQAQPPAPPPPPPPAAPVPPPAETPAPKRTRTPKSKP